MVLGRLFQKSRKNKWAVDRLHQSILGQALRPDFYFEGGARDNFSGRFEMASLHAALAFRRLRELGAAGRGLAQACFDALFSGFDEALRDIGTGDLTVGKKIRKLGEAFYGRAKAYDVALADGSPSEALAQALMRNLGVSEAAAPAFVKYVQAVERTLARHSREAMLSGDVNWPKPPAQAA